MAVYTGSVVGAGMGGRASIRGLAESGCYELKAVADLSADVCAGIESEYPGVLTFTSSDAMFRECPTDVVCIATYPPTHKPITLQALELPLKGILVEKPLSDSAAGGRDIVAAIKARGLPATVPHGLLAMRHADEIAERVHNGEIGDLRLVEIQCTRWDIINAGIHWLNFFVKLVGDDTIATVQAAADKRTRTFRDGMQVETEAVTFVTTCNGVRAVMQTGDEVEILNDGILVYRIIGTAGIIEFDGWDSHYHIRNDAHPNGQHYDVEVYSPQAHQRHLEQLAAQIDAGTTDYAVVDSSQTALEIVEAAYVSARHSCQVRFPLADFKPPAGVDWDPGMPYSGTGGGRNGRLLPRKD